jgi:FMN reductase
MEFSVRALRGWAVPMVLPVAQSWSVFNPEGRLIDTTISDELHGLGAEVVRAAVQFQREGTCDYAENRQFAAQFRRAGLSGCSVYLGIRHGLWAIT